MKKQLVLIAVFFVGSVFGSILALRLAGGLALDRVPREILFYQAGPDCVWPEPHQTDEARIYHNASDRGCVHGNNYVWFPTDVPCLHFVYAPATALPDAATTETRKVLE